MRAHRYVRLFYGGNTSAGGNKGFIVYYYYVNMTVSQLLVAEYENGPGMLWLQILDRIFHVLSAHGLRTMAIKFRISSKLEIQDIHTQPFARVIFYA